MFTDASDEVTTSFTISFTKKTGTTVNDPRS